jgi:ribosomal protein S18 acetylase RimI-like enzyme
VSLVPPGYRLRPARADELDALTAIERAAAVRFREVGLEEVMASVVTPRAHLEAGLETGRLVVAATAPFGACVGFALVSVLDGDAHLEELDVLPEHGRRGLGRALVLNAMAIGAREGRPRITLSTLTLVPWNAPFYERLGFRALRDDEVGPELRAACAGDRERGLPDDGRVIMGRALPRPPMSARG